MTYINWDEMKTRNNDKYKELEPLFKLNEWSCDESEYKPVLTKSDIYKTTKMTQDTITFYSLGLKRVFTNWVDYSNYIFQKYGVRV